MNTLAIQNYNRGDSQLCLFAEYPISYETDIDKAVDILKEEVGKLYKPNKKDVEFPKIRVISWQNSSILLRAWVWGKDSGEAYENLYHLNYVIKKRFQEEKIEIPYDKLDVNLKK
jgi:small-conductance mechanosensitive channel